jgi:hypothetical protein
MGQTGYYPSLGTSVWSVEFSSIGDDPSAKHFTIDAAVPAVHPVFSFQPPISVVHELSLSHPNFLHPKSHTQIPHSLHHPSVAHSSEPAPAHGVSVHEPPGPFQSQIFGRQYFHCLSWQQSASVLHSPQPMLQACICGVRAKRLLLKAGQARAAVGIERAIRKVEGFILELRLRVEVGVEVRE